MAVLLVLLCSTWAVGAFPWLTPAQQVRCFSTEPKFGAFSREWLTHRLLADAAHRPERNATAHNGVPGSARSMPARLAHTKVFVLNISEVAAELGLPTCSEDDVVTDPEALIVLPHPSLTPNFTAEPPEPPEGHEWIYPYAHSPHYNSQNAGPWSAWAANSCC